MELGWSCVECDLLLSNISNMKRRRQKNLKRTRAMKRVVCLLVREHDEKSLSQLLLAEQIKQFLFCFMHAKAVSRVQNEQQSF